FVKEMFSIFKRRNPNVKMVIGGGKSTVTSLPGVNYWVWGAADRSVVALANYLEDGSPLVTHPGRTGEVISSRNYPFTDHSKSKIIWQSNDYLFEREHLPIEINRGCIFRCIFCANPLHRKKGEFEKSIDVLQEELLYNYDHFGTTGYMFCDDTYNDTMEKVASLHKMFKKLPFELEWSGYGRVDVINKYPEQREMLLESGLRAILVGIETFHPVTAKGVGKGLHPDKVKETLYYLRETWRGKVIITGSFIVGLPGES
ncbi:unnamed protein product, partial [marine sediment metagenome]